LTIGQVPFRRDSRQKITDYDKIEEIKYKDRRHQGENKPIVSVEWRLVEERHKIFGHVDDPKGYATLGAFPGGRRLIALQRAAPYWASQLNRRDALKGASVERRAIVSAISSREGDAAYRLFLNTSSQQ
jgi:hypothetical protein